MPEEVGMAARPRVFPVRVVPASPSEVDELLRLRSGRDAGRFARALKVRGLPYSATERELREFFAGAPTPPRPGPGSGPCLNPRTHTPSSTPPLLAVSPGLPVRTAVVIMTPGGRSSGDGVVEFDGEAACRAAMSRNRVRRMPSLPVPCHPTPPPHTAHHQLLGHHGHALPRSISGGGGRGGHRGETGAGHGAGALDAARWRCGRGRAPWRAQGGRWWRLA